MTYDNSDCLVIVDGNNLTQRSHYAFKELRTTSDWESGALYGNVTALAAMFTELNPTHMLWCFDRGKSEFRTELLPTYKAHRIEARDRHIKYAGIDEKPLHEVLAPQYIAFEEFLKIRGVDTWAVQGWEADDLIAAVVLKAKNKMPVFIVSGDHDMEQLVEHTPTSRVTVYKPNLAKGADRFFGPDEVRKKYGVEPEQLSQLFALTGDKSDNIDGIKGVGPKTAAKWINKYGNLAEILENEPKVMPGDRARISTNFFLMDLAQPGIEYKPTISGLRIPTIPPWKCEDEMYEFLGRWEIRNLTVSDFGGR